MAAFLGLLLISISVGLSNFAGAIGIGLSGVEARTRIRVGIAFGFFEGVMPLIGVLIGHSLAGPLSTYGRRLGGLLLILTGAYTIWQGRRTEREAGPTPATLSRRALLVTALALSIDNLVVGFALGVYPVNVVLAAALMGTVSVGMSLLGLELGQRLGSRIEAWSEELGGGVLVLVGVGLIVGIG